LSGIGNAGDLEKIGFAKNKKTKYAPKKPDYERKKYPGNLFLILGFFGF